MSFDPIQTNASLPLKMKPEAKPINGNEASRDIQLWEKAKEMEGIFITQMVKAMEKTIPSGGIGGEENSLPSMMFSQVMGESIASQGGMGLAEMLYKSLEMKDTMPSMNEMSTDAYLQSLDIVKGLGKK